MRSSSLGVWVCVVLKTGGDITGGEVAEGDARAEGDAGAWVGAVHDRIHFIAGGVQAGDRCTAAVEHVGLAVGDQSAGRAEVAGKQTNGVERRLVQRLQARGGSMERVTHVAVIGAAAFAELPVD